MHSAAGRGIDRATDGRQRVGNGPAKDDQPDDRQHAGERQDQAVFDEPLS